MGGSEAELDAAVDAFVDLARRRDLALDGVHVQQTGVTAVERHPTPDLRRDVFSAAKTVTSMAIGIAAAEGRLSLADPVLLHLPQFAGTAAPGAEAITVDQLLQMTSGIVYRWDDPDADGPGDPAAAVLAAPLGAEPGRAFAYRGGNSYLLSRIVEASTGEDLRDFLLPRLFAPLGIGNPQWLRCPLGFSLGAVGLLLRTEELGRLGRTLLDGGRYDRRQLIPRGLRLGDDRRPGRHRRPSCQPGPGAPSGQRPLRTSRLAL